MNKKPIHLVSGELCSGKGTYCNALRNTHGYEIISVSDTVRAISGKTKRSELTKTSDLDSQILSSLVIQIEKNFKLQIPVIVDGIRQVSIAQGIVDHFGKENVTATWLDVDKDEQQSRFKNRSADKDDQDLDSLLQLDKELGTLDVRAWMQSSNGQIVKN